jgi:hypothetical protein
MGRIITAWLIALSGVLNAAQASIGNDDILSMCKAGLSIDVVVNAINAATEHRFDLTPQALIRLAQAGVPDIVIREMQKHAAAKSAPTLGEARTGFLINEAVGPASMFPNDRFRDLEMELRKWNPSFFQITDRPDAADVTITLRIVTHEEGAVYIPIARVAANLEERNYLLLVRQRATGTILWSGIEPGTSQNTITRLLSRLTHQIDAARLPTLITGVDIHALPVDRRCLAVAASLSKIRERKLAKRIRAAQLGDFKGWPDDYLESVFKSAFPCLAK